MTTEVINGVSMAFEICISCGCRFAMPEDMNWQFRRNHESFYCPSGHKQYYPAKSEEEKLRESLHAERVKVMELEEENRRAQRTAHQGCCPVKGCGQHIRDLDRHMRRKHGEK